ncbi:MAG: DUF4252 domain-containing protein [Prevotella sp.]|jgi:DNA replication protein DnaC
MKKWILMLLTVLVCQAGWAQSVAESLVNEYASKKHATFVDVPKPLVSTVLKPIVKGDSVAADLAKRVDKAQVLVLDECSRSVRKHCNDDVLQLMQQGYQIYTRVTTQGNNLLILTSPNKENATELVMSITGGGNCTVVVLNGTFDEQFFEELGKVIS